MIKTYLRLDIAVILAVTLLLIIFMLQRNQSAHLPSTSAAKNSGGLSVSQDGSQSTTNVSAAALQSADAPSGATSGSEVNPQQSVSNYTP